MLLPVRKIYRIVWLIVAGGALGGCGFAKLPSADVKTPDIKNPDLKINFRDLPGFDRMNVLACQLDEGKQPEAKGDALLAMDGLLTAQFQNKRVFGCDGTVKYEGIAEVREGRALVSLEADQAGLKEPAAFARIRNDRTCLFLGADASEGDLGSYDLWPKLLGEVIAPSPPQPALSKSGSLRFALMTGGVRMGGGLPVASGRNQIVIVYYGKCAKSLVDRRPGTPDSEGCVEAPVLRTVVLQVNATIRAETIPGITESRDCRP